MNEHSRFVLTPQSHFVSFLDIPLRDIHQYKFKYTYRQNIIMLTFPNLSGEEDKNTPTSKKL